MLAIRSAAILLALGFAAGCSNPCNNACSRITRCVSIQGLDDVGCRYVCESIQRTMAERKQQVQFDRFVNCAETLNYRDKSMCNGEFQKCAGLIPGPVWQQALGEAKRLRGGR